MSEQGSNEGIQIFGGTVKAEQLAVGRGASAHKSVSREPVSQPGGPVLPVLLVTANPRDTDHLYVEEEVRAIQQAIQQSRYRERIKLDICPAATVDDLRRALLHEQYQIVHIAGHGLPEGVVLADEQGYSRVVPAHSLAALFRAHTPTLRCIVLNACYSLKPGQQISLGVTLVIAMEGVLNDRLAIEFARGFYDALGAGKEIKRAYEEGCIAVGLVSPYSAFASHLFVSNY